MFTEVVEAIACPIYSFYGLLFLNGVPFAVLLETEFCLVSIGRFGSSTGSIEFGLLEP